MTPPHYPVGAPSPTPTPTPVASTTVSSTVPLNGGAALINATLSTALPAPSGYAQTISLPIVNAAAGAQVAITAGLTPPASAVPLQSRSTYAAGRFGSRSPQASGSFSVLFYDFITPNTDLTVAGALTSTFTLPASNLSASTSYYLAFYDPTAAAPAWQTIAGPVSPSGVALTFSGTVKPITFKANQQYGFAVFSTVTAAATPPPAPQTLVYFGGASGITIATEAGSTVAQLAIPTQTFDLDDTGNIYSSYHTRGVPGVTIQKFAPGSTTVIATYTPSVVDQPFISVSGSGELVAPHLQSDGTLLTDEWDPGASGAPSRTITTHTSPFTIAFVMRHDGTLYLPDRNAAGVPTYGIYPAGSGTPSSTITESIVPASQYANFTSNYAAVGPDGTLYVTEYTFDHPDPNAGLYIYPLKGAERFIATATDANGAGPQGVDVDSANDIFVVNNNSSVINGGTDGCQGDSLASITKYGQDGTLLGTIPGINGAYPITVASDGTAFVASFPVQFQASCATTGTGAVYAIPPGSTTATAFADGGSGSSDIVLYDGTHKTKPFSLGHGGSGMSGRGGPRRIAR